MDWRIWIRRAFSPRRRAPAIRGSANVIQPPGTTQAIGTVTPARLRAESAMLIFSLVGWGVQAAYPSIQLYVRAAILGVVLILGIILVIYGEIPRVRIYWWVRLIIGAAWVWFIVSGLINLPWPHKVPYAPRAPLNTKDPCSGSVAIENSGHMFNVVITGGKSSGFQKFICNNGKMESIQVNHTDIRGPHNEKR